MRQGISFGGSETKRILLNFIKYRIPHRQRDSFGSGEIKRASSKLL
jgi:hypothetical protein